MSRSKLNGIREYGLLEGLGANPRSVAEQKLLSSEHKKDMKASGVRKPREEIV